MNHRWEEIEQKDSSNTAKLSNVLERIGGHGRDVEENRRGHCRVTTCRSRNRGDAAYVCVGGEDDMPRTVINRRE